MRIIRLKRLTAGLLLGACVLSTSNASAQVQESPEKSSTAKDIVKSKDADLKDVEKAKPATIEKTKLGKTRNVSLVGKNLLCGQPSLADLKLAKQQGVKTIVSLRESSEIDWDEAAAAKALGLEYVPIPFRAPGTLHDDVFDKVRKALQGSDEKPIMLHCGSANRVGAVWLAYRVLDENVPLEQAKKEAKQVGLRTEGYLDKALDYIHRKQDSSKHKSDKKDKDSAKKDGDTKDSVKKEDSAKN